MRKDIIDLKNQNDGLKQLLRDYKDRKPSGPVRVPAVAQR